MSVLYVLMLTSPVFALAYTCACAYAYAYVYAPVKIRLKLNRNENFKHKQFLTKNFGGHTSLISTI